MLATIEGLKEFQILFSIYKNEITTSKMKNKLLLLALFLSFHCISQELYKDTLLKQDFDILTKITCEVSPNINSEEKKALYDYLNKRSEALNGKKMTALDFFKFLMDTQAETKLDDHGEIILSGALLKTLLTDQKTLFPIPILIMNKKLVVNYEEAEIPFGSIISAINKVPVSVILENVLKEENTYALKELEQNFDGFYLIKYGALKTFTVTYTLPNSSTTKTIKLNAVGVKARKSIYINRVYPLNRKQPKNIVNTTYFKNSDLYYIQLNSFFWNEPVKNVYRAFNKQFSNIFKKIRKRKAKHLIIDLRNNRGGDILIPALFYSYIAKEAFNENISVQIPDFEFPHKDLIVKIENTPVDQESIQKFINQIKKPFVKNKDAYEYAYVNNVKRVKNKKSYKGKVYLLVGGRTFSAAAYYTALFKNSKRGLIVGEQVGGSHHEITGGKIIEYTLPNTKIGIKIPIALMKFSQALETNVPEQKINPTIQITEAAKYQYFLKKEDWDLQTVLEIINQKK